MTPKKNDLKLKSRSKVAQWAINNKWFGFSVDFVPVTLIDWILCKNCFKARNNACLNVLTSSNLISTELKSYNNAEKDWYASWRLFIFLLANPSLSINNKNQFKHNAHCTRFIFVLNILFCRHNLQSLLIFVKWY